MKTYTAKEAQLKMIEIMDSFIELCSQYDRPIKLYTLIENIGFTDMIILYYRLKTHKKQLILPQQLDGETMCIMYTPVPGCVICFESVQCQKVMPNLNTLKDPFLMPIRNDREICAN